MKNRLLLLVSMLILSVGSMWGQQTVTAGAQVTDLSSIVSGKAYLLQHQGNGTNKPWIEDAGTYYNCPNTAGNCNVASVWYLIKVSDGIYKIENAFTGKYWPKPTGNANLVGTTAANAGEWTLNMTTNGVCAPTCNGYRLNRNTPNLVGWNSGSGSVTQMKIYEVTASTLSTSTSYPELISNVEIIPGNEATSITEGQWYLLKSRGRSGYAYEDNGSLKNTASFTTSATAGAKYLVRFLNAGDGKYYIQNGLGNYFGQVGHDTAVPTNVIGTEKYTCGTIASTAGHFYFTSATDNYVLDCQGNGYPVVGWNKDIPTETGGNNDWALYPVTITSETDIWTINNTNTNRGPLIYAPARSEKWVWVSGKDNAPALNPNNTYHQWIFYPTGTSGQYYLYNVGCQKFIIPVTGGTYLGAGGYSGHTWAFSNEAVAVNLSRQSDGTYKISTVKGSKYIAISKSYTGPVINYNDVGANFTLTKVAEASSSVKTQITTAVNKLIDSQDKLTAKPTSDGWYAIKIQSRTDQDSYANNYLYTLASEYVYNSTPYPLSHANSPAGVRPLISDATYYFHITKSGNYYMIKLPNGRFLKTDGSYFPISAATGTTIDIQYTSNTSSYFMFKASSYYADAYDNFIGETGTEARTKYDIYPINLTTAGLTAWTVSIAESTGTETLTCTHTNASGLTTVYNNGYIFLPTSTTPTASDFSVTGVSYGYQVRVDGSAKTITVVNIDAEFAALKAASKFDILEGSTVMGPSEFAAPAEINDAIDAAQEVADNADAKITFIESTNGTKIQNYLNQVAQYGALANIKITMNKEYGTMILPCPCTRIDGLDIYSCSDREDNTLTLTTVAGNYAQNVPYIIHADAGSKYTIIGWDKGSTATHTSGWLTGALNSTTDIPSGSYMLATNKSTGVQAFYQVSGSGVKCGINKCYLTVPSVTEARTLYLDIDGEITAIEEVFGNKTEHDAIYNLAGQRLTKTQKGINIINGKKVIK